MTTVPSFVKVNYTLRPSKQVERKLIVELLQKLSIAMPEYDVGTYTYLGFGSVYYTDFVLFHKYLYMDRMICVESQDIPQRMEFNRPYDFIKLDMRPYGEVIPEIDRDRRHLIWLDYDSGLSEEQLMDIRGTIQVLAPGSFVLVTVDGEPRTPSELESESMSLNEKRRVALAQFEGKFGSWIAERLERKDYSPKRFPTVLATIIGNQMSAAAKARQDVEFLQLVNFRYKDGAQMVSLGGLLDRPERIEKVMASEIMDLEFVNQGVTPKPISVPWLTVREKLWLDRTSEDATLAFEVDSEMVESFRRYRRHYPNFHEALL